MADIFSVIPQGINDLLGVVYLFMTLSITNLTDNKNSSLPDLDRVTEWCQLGFSESKREVLHLDNQHK